MHGASSIRSRQCADCDSCKLRGKPCVLGFGNTDRPDIAFIGEAPGENEVTEGRPFVGKSGNFLRTVIKDLGIDASRCYFTNMCLCRPDGNKKPSAVSIKACRPRLIREISALQPKLVMALGGVPTSGFLNLKRGITKCHGEYKVLKFKSGFQVGAFPTYHPSGVMRAPDFYIDFAEELLKAKEVLEGRTPVIEPPYGNYEFVTNQRDFDAFLRELTRQKLSSCDIETDTELYTTGKIISIAFSWKREHAFVVDWPVLLHGDMANTSELDTALKDVCLSFHYGMYDVPFLTQAGMHHVNYYFDTMLAHYLLDERQATHGLERLAIRYYDAPAYKSKFRESLGIRGHVSDEAWATALAKADKPNLFRYNGADADYTFRLTQDLALRCKEEGQISVLKNVEMPSAHMFMDFHMNGMLIDWKYWRNLAKGWRNEIKQLEAEMRQYPGADFKLGSTKKLAAYLYDTLKLLPFGGEKSFEKKKIDEDDISKAIIEVEDPEAREYWTSKRTQMSEGLKGFGGESKGLVPRSTTTYMLYYLRQQHPFPGLLIKWRHARKRYGMYYKGIKKVLWPDMRVHPEYDMTATRTGRKATKKPAIHNLPRGDEIYNIYVADPGWIIIHADYKTAEMRMMAHYAEDWHLLEILDTSDIHSTYAMQIFNLSEEEFKKLDSTTVKNMRIASKMITFGIPYGRSAAGLAPQLGKTKAECEEYIKTYFQDYAPRVEVWLEEVRDEGTKNQVITSVFGRKRRFPFIRDKYHRREVKRQLGNFKIQSTINDLTLLAQIHSLTALKQAGIPAKPWPHIHDSLNILVPIPLWKPAVQIINAVMVKVPFKTEVSFPAEIEIGTRWGEMTVVMEKGEWVEPKKVEKEVENLYDEAEVAD